MNKFNALQILGLTGKVSNEDIKLAYRRKAAEFHPDRNPAGVEIMKMINTAYEIVKNETDITVYANAAMAQYPEKLAAAINALFGLGLDIEICRLWVWVGGNTKEHKEILKNAGYCWSSVKTKWYYRPADQKSKKYSNETWSMEKIRAKFGSIKPEEKQHYALPA